MNNDIGRIYAIDRVTQKDKDTGVEVTRLTDNQGHTRHPYFTQNLISEDGRSMLVTSDRTGSEQLYLLDLKRAQMVQLTAEVGPQSVRWVHSIGKVSAGGSPCLDGKRMIAYYWSNNVLKSVDLVSLKTDEYYRVPDGFVPGILSMTNDGQYIDFVYSESVPLSTSTWMEHLYRRPASVVVRVSVQTKRAVAIWGEREWISHVNTSPVDPDIVLFCHEGPWHLVQRMWVVRISTGECWPLVEQETGLERAGHEFFTVSGKVAAQYAIRDTYASEWRAANLLISPDGSNRETYWFPAAQPNHIQVNHQETLAVGDSIFLNPDHADGINYIGLIKHERQKADLTLLCRHDTDWAITHPHPIFTPDDKNVIFDSTREGKANVYLAPVLVE